jgi:hypothetical protein
MAHDAIVRLLSVPEADHDLDWLKQSLQAAIELEFATIPPYLCALWSVKDLDNDPVAASIRVIVKEEMLHMGLSCNMLTAVGGTPALNTPGFIPAYPGELPGGVHKGLIVPLQRLSKSAAELFMNIEFPEEGPIALALTASFGEEFPTIGAFYAALAKAFETLQPALSIERQLAGPPGLKKLASLDDIRLAIDLIQRQGEGSKMSPEDTGPNDLAHYYRFKEIFVEKQLHLDPATNVWKFDGPPLPLPETWPMAEVPAGGYQKADVPDEVTWNLIQEFDRTFSEMLNLLQAAWRDGDKDSLSSASFGSMPTLTDLAGQITQKPISPERGNYGPCFRLI